MGYLLLCKGNIKTLVKVSKQQLQVMRDEGWESILTEVSSFYEKHQIPISNMDDTFIIQRRPRLRAPQITNLHHCFVELFYTVIDMQLQELNIVLMRWTPSCFFV